MTDLIRKINFKNRRSINQSLVMLGVDKKIVYVKLGGLKQGTIYERIEPERLEELATKAYKKKIREYHPDLNFNLDFYQEATKEINSAYQKVLRLIKSNKGKTYDDVMNYVSIYVRI